MFYWLAEARDGNRSAPVIVWLMGGPGAPSSVYFVQAMGPLRVTYGGHGEFSQEMNPDTWNEHYAMLYLDQPLGTGFSFVEHSGGFAKTDEEAAGHLATAIPTILEKYGKKKNDLYVFGVSYGGKMAPLLAQTLLLVGKKDSSRAVNLKGIGIGNGLVDPISTVRSYSFHYHARGFIDGAVADEVKKLEGEAALMISSGDTCRALKYLDEKGQILKKIHEASDVVNWYDLREAFSPVQYFSPITAALYYLQHIQKLLPVGPRPFPVEKGGLNYTAYGKLKCAIARSSKPQVDALLQAGIRVLIYNGADDGMVPVASTRGWLKSLSAHANVGLQKSHQQIWKLDGKVVGYWRADPTDQLSEVLILHAGHMAVKDQPAVAKAMVERFLEGNLGKEDADEQPELELG